MPSTRCSTAVYSTYGWRHVLYFTVTACTCQEVPVVPATVESVEVRGARGHFVDHAHLPPPAHHNGSPFLINILSPPPSNGPKPKQLCFLFSATVRDKRPETTVGCAVCNKCSCDTGVRKLVQVKCLSTKVTRQSWTVLAQVRITHQTHTSEPVLRN